MGVRGLETFIKNQVPNGIFPINILDEIEAHKSKYSNAPILVFDVMGMLHGVYECFDPIERLCGGNYKKLHDVFENFFLKLTNAGAKLVFFIDGPIHDSKYDTWHTRRNDEYKKYCYIFDAIQSNVSLNMIANYLFKTIDFSPTMCPAMKDLKHLCKKYGICRIAIDIECDTEIAKYATKNDALAVFGNDTDYLIYEGEWRYWSVKDLNLLTQDWNTFEFNKQALRKYLNLNSKQMILFSMISGNDVIPIKYLKHLHNKIHRLDSNVVKYDYKKQHFLDISKYVRSFSTKLSHEEILLLSQDIFFSQKDENYALIEDAIRFYDINVEVTIKDPLLLQAAVHSIFMYDILAGLPYSYSIPFYDLRRNDFLHIHEIVFPLLARQVGLVRQHMDDLSYIQIVETKITHACPYTAINLHPVYPPVLLPDLMELVFNESNRYYQRLRFTLLKWLIFDDVQSTLAIDEIPNGYVVTVLSLMYLLKINQITILEADAILLTTYQVNESIHIQCKPPRHVDTRTLIVVSLYTELHNWIANCCFLVGLGKFTDYLMFDGVRFVHLLNLLKCAIRSDSEAYNHAIDNIRFHRTFFGQIL